MMTVAEQSATGYRCIEARLIEQWLMLCGGAYEWNRGERDQVLREARNALSRWLDLGLGSTQAEHGERLFDPVEVFRFVKMAAMTGQDRYWYETFVKTGRDLISEFHGPEPIASEPARPRSLPPKRFRIQISRQFGLDAVAPRHHLLLRLPLPLEDRSLRDLTIESTSSTVTASNVSRAPDRLEWRIFGGLDQSVTISAVYNFVAFPVFGDPEADRLSSRAIDLYTRPREGLIRVSPRIAALAREIAGDEPDQWVQVQRIWNFILDNLECCFVHYDQIGTANPSEWVLDNGVFDCQLGCALLISLCRSLGIPARLASGYMLYSVAPTYHYWAEIFIVSRGWVPVDLSCWDLSAGGQDAFWRDYFLGALDYRCKTELLPRYFAGLSAVRLGERWQMLQLPLLGGVETRFLSIETGRLIYSDRTVILPERA
jgi:Transglutaminase-like superfamily